MMKTRFLLAEQCAAELLKKRVWVYSPIVHCHELATKHQLPTTFEFWRDYNFAMLRVAEQCFVLDIPGVKESVGVQGEIAFAQTAGIPVFSIDPEAKKWPA
jgi:hypothetical protein